MKLIVKGNASSQKNDKIIGYRYSGGKRVPFIMSSKKSKEYREDAAKELALQFKGYKVTEFPISVSIVFYFSTDIRRDLDNAAAGVMDALTQSGILPDDNTKYVDCITLQYGGIDKNNPRTEIFLDE
ncbi:RusA family crossover junction endodeoxyribonuclease [Candidatus Dependentiae bacterium]|nr:MAG: RusA family crossover junction endodeoxyribonuclease [Candidatus Dependentiae bacterium]